MREKGRSTWDLGPDKQRIVGDMKNRWRTERIKCFSKQADPVLGALELNERGSQEQVGFSVAVSG